MQKRIFTLILAFSFILCLMPCERSSAMSGKVKLSKKKVRLNVAQSCKIKLVAAKRKKVKWCSSNKKVASVKKGLIRAKRQGQAVVVAKYAGKKYRCEVQVRDAQVDSNVPAASKAPFSALLAVDDKGGVRTEPVYSEPHSNSTVAPQPTVTPAPTTVAAPTETGATALPTPDEGEKQEYQNFDNVVMDAEIDARNSDMLLLKISNHSGMDIAIGTYFTLDHYENGQWRRVEFKDSCVFPDIALIIRDDSEYTHTINLDQYFAGLSAGRYRITEEISGRMGQGIVQTEFAISESGGK